METGDRMTADPMHLRMDYMKRIERFISEYKYSCLKNKIDYYQIDSSSNLATVLTDFLRMRKKVGG